MVSDYEKCVAEKRVDDKTNELTVLPSVMASLCIVGALVSVDAMGTRIKSYISLSSRIILISGVFILTYRSGRIGHILTESDTRFYR